jgi:ANTAR domain
MAVPASFVNEDDLCPNCLHLVRAVESRDLIGQAKGILMEREGCTAEAAFRRLVEASQRSNMKVVDVAAEISASAGRHVEPHAPRANRLPSAKATGTSSDKNRDEHRRLGSPDHERG